MIVTLDSPEWAEFQRQQRYLWEFANMVAGADIFAQAAIVREATNLAAWEACFAAKSKVKR